MPHFDLLPNVNKALRFAAMVETSSEISHSLSAKEAIEIAQGIRELAKFCKTMLENNLPGNIIPIPPRLQLLRGGESPEIKMIKKGAKKTKALVEFSSNLGNAPFSIPMKLFRQLQNFAGSRSSVIVLTPILRKEVLGRIELIRKSEPATFKEHFKDFYDFLLTEARQEKPITYQGE